MKQLFISYSSNDLPTAEKICHLLESDGIGCWIAPRDVMPGAIYAEEIINAIENADAFLLICSRYTNDSVHVRSEVEHAFSHRKKIFPVRIEDVELGKAYEYFLGSSHWLTTWDTPLEDCIKRLAESVRASSDRDSGAPTAGKTEGEKGAKPVADADPAAQVPSNNLPAQATTLIGREKEVEEISGLLTRDDVRLVTLTGPGGIGKTRLGLQVAERVVNEFEDGVFFVPLAPIVDEELVPSAIAQVLDVQNPGGKSFKTCLKEYLENKRLLLLLDNFEHIVTAAPVIAELLSNCGTLTVLVTSREVLHLSGEHDYQVPALNSPWPIMHATSNSPEVADIIRFDAVRLFIDRAQAADAGFAVTDETAPVIAEICHRLDGLPLAIELAVARIQILTPAEILERLKQRLPLLGRGARDMPARHRTLTATIEWSFGLLDEHEKCLFSRLGIFVGGWTLDAAEKVCSANMTDQSEFDVMEGIASLAEKSLVKRVEAASGKRFHMLETIRAYAVDRFEEGEEREEIRSRHAEYYSDLAEQVDAGIRGPKQLQWRQLMLDELSNFRASSHWLRKVNPDAALQAVLSLWWFWQTAGFAGEGLGLITALLDQTGISPRTRARALNRGGLLAATQTEYKQAIRFGREGLQLTASIGDDGETALALFVSTIAHYLTGDFDEVKRLAGESITCAEKVGDMRVYADAKRILGLAEGRLGDFEEGIRSLEQAATLFRDVGDRLNVAYTLRNLGFILLLSGDAGRAIPLCKESLSISKEMNDRWSMARVFIHLASASALHGDEPARAARLFGIAHKLHDDIGTHVPPSEREIYDESIEVARAAIGNIAFDSDWLEGESMDLDRAVEYALEIAAEGRQ